MKKTRWLFLIVALAIFAIAPLKFAAGAQSREFRKTVEFAPGGDLRFNTDKGSVRLTLPSKSGFHLDASTRNGNVSSDYPELGANPDDEKNTSNIKGTVGKGNSKIVVSTDVGDIDIRKSTT